MPEQARPKGSKGRTRCPTTDDWTGPSAFETTRLWVRSPPPRHGPGSEPTSVTHGSFLYNSIYRFDDQAAAPPPTAARTKTSGCGAMTTCAGSLQAPTWRIKTLSANVSGICICA